MREAADEHPGGRAGAARRCPGQPRPHPGHRGRGLRPGWRVRVYGRGGPPGRSRNRHGLPSLPTKAALLEAVLVRRLDRLRGQAEALLDAPDPGEAFLGLFDHLVAHAAAKIAGAVRDDVELPEVYALLVGASRAAARARLDEEARARLFGIILAGLAPGPARPATRGSVRRA